MQVDDGVALKITSLTYAYPGHHPVIRNFSLELPVGARCLLVGANGAGKSSLLQILAGKHMVGESTVRIHGRSAFHDIALETNGELSYLGPQWRQNIAFAGSDVPLQGDFSAGKMIYGVEGIDAKRRERLIDLLDIDLDWRITRLSDGQRRRVQICMGLLKPYKVLLLDEITVDMDVVGRLDLLKFFQEETRERGATIVYATHIFDGLENWLSHIAHIASGELVRGGPANQIQELAAGKKLLGIVEKWLKEELDKEECNGGGSLAKAGGRAGSVLSKQPLMPSKHMAFYR